MSSIKEQLINMFSKVMGGTVTREEGAMLLNDLAKGMEVEVLKELTFLVENPPPEVHQKTILHTIALTHNEAFLSIMISSLANESSEISTFAADELARLKTDEAKLALVEHLSVEDYNVRKVSAAAFARNFGAEGIEFLVKHIMEHPEPLYRSTSAYALLGAGRPGLEALLSILSCQHSGPIQTVAEVIEKAGVGLDGNAIRSVIDAILLVGDRGDEPAIAALLKAVASLGPGARGLEVYVMAFADHPSEPVRNAARDTLEKIGSGGGLE
jgi:HEAT repeat protein